MKTPIYGAPAVNGLNDPYYGPDTRSAFLSESHVLVVVVLGLILRTELPVNQEFAAPPPPPNNIGSSPFYNDLTHMQLVLKHYHSRNVSEKNRFFAEESLEL